MYVLYASSLTRLHVPRYSLDITIYFDFIITVTPTKKNKKKMYDPLSLVLIIFLLYISYSFSTFLVFDFATKLSLTCLLGKSSGSFLPSFLHLQKIDQTLTPNKCPTFKHIFSCHFYLYLYIFIFNNF